MANTDFSILLNAIINKSGISTELKQVQQIVNKYSIDIMPELKTASLRNQMKAVSKDIANDFNKTFGTNLTGNDVFKAFETQVKQTENAIKDTRKEYEKLQAISSQKLVDNQANKIKESNTLLSQQRSEYQSIWDINEKIARLNPNTNKNEIISLQEEKKYHQENYLSIQKQLGSYSDVINNEEKLNSLLDIQKQSRLNIANINSKQSDSNNQKTITNQKKLYTEAEQAYKINDKFNNSLEITKIRAEGAEKSFNSYIKTLRPQALKEYATEIKSISNAFSETSKSGDKISYTKATASLSKFKATMKNTGMETSSLTQIIKNNILAFANWYSVGNLVASFARNIKDGVEFVSELDDALTNINYTMDVTSNDLKNIGMSSIDIAKDLNTSAKNVLEAVKLYANANETAQSILSKAKPAIMLSNVTGMSGTGSAEMLQSIMNQFDLTQNDLMQISDTIQGVSQSMAHDFSDGIKQIAEGISTSGSVAHDAGLSLQEYSSMLGLVIEQTGEDGGSIGNAMKTILTRITKASTTAGTLTEDISKAETSLKSVGVGVRDSAGEFRDMTAIMSDLGKVWNNLSSVQQSNISFNIAGTRQTNIIKSLLNNWQEYETLVDKANNSSGTTFENQNKYAESLKGKLSELSAVWQSIWAETIDSSGLKFLADTGTEISKLVDNIGLFNTVLGVAGVVAIVKFYKSLDLLKLKSLEASGMLVGLTDVEIANASSTVGLTAALDGLKIAFLSNPLFLAGTVVAGLIGFQYAIEKVTKSSDELITKVKDLTSETENLQTEYNNLSTRDDLVESEKNRLGLLQAQIEANKILIEQEMKKAYAVYQAEQKVKTTADDSYAARTGNKAPTSLTINTERSSVSDMLAAYEKLNKMKATSVEQDDKIIAKKAELKGALASAAEKLESYKESGIELSESDKQFLNQIYSITNALSTQGSTTKETTSATSDLSNELDNASEKIPTLADALSALSDDNKLMSDVKDEIKEIGTISTDTAQKILSTYPELESAIQDYLMGKISEKELIADMQTAYKTDFDNYRQMVISKKLLNEDFYQKVVNGLSNSVKEEAKSCGVSFENYKNLQEAKLGIYQRFASEVAKVEGLLAQNSQTSYEDALIRTTKFVSPLSTIISGLDKSIDGSLNLKGYTPSSSDLSSDKGSKNSGSSSSDDTYLDAFNAEKATLDHKLAMDEMTEKQYYDKLEKLNNKYFKKHQKKYLEQYRQNQEEVYKGRKQLDEEAKDKAEKKAEERLQAEQKQIEGVISKYQTALSDINDTASNSENGSNEQISAYTKGLKTAGDEVSYLESQVAKLKKQYKDGKISQENYTEQLENLTDKLNEAKESVKSYQKSIIESIKAQQEAQTDLVTDAYEKEKDAIEDRYDTELDSLNKIIDAKKKSLQADKEAQDYAKNLQDKTDNLADINDRITDLSKAANSDDREAQAELKKLQEDRKKAQDELDELQADHKLSVEEDALDKLADDYQTQSDKNKTIDLDKAKTVYDDKLAKINALYQREEELITHASEYTKKQFSESLKEINTQLADLGINTPKSTTNGLVNSYNDLTGISANGSNDAKILSILSNGNGKGLGTSELNKYISSNYGSQLSYSQMAELADLLGMSGVTTKNIVGDNKAKDEILKKLKKSGFHSGGYVDASMIRATGEDGLALVRHGEPILTVEQGKQFSELIKNIQPLNNLVKLSTPNISNITTNNNTSSPTIQVILPANTIIDNNAINNYRKLIPELTNAVSEQLMNAQRQYR